MAIINYVMSVKKDSLIKNPPEEEKAREEYIRKHGHRMLDDPGDWVVTKSPGKRKNKIRVSNLDDIHGNIDIILLVKII